MRAKVSIPAVVDRASALFAVTPDAILGRRKHPRVFRARAAVALAVRAASSQRRSYQQIGLGLGGRDHKTIIHACDRAEYHCARDSDYRARCDALIRFAREHAAGRSVTSHDAE